MADTADTARGPRTAVLSAAAAALLAGPTVLAFFAGGYFNEPRAWAGMAAWVCVAVALVVVRRPLPSGRPAWIAIGALAALSGWTLLSMIWAPIAGSAYHAGQIDVVYLGALLAAAMLLRERVVARALEPALVAGSVIVIGYGLSERFLPGLVHLASSITAEGRLDQPLSYWNAMGELAAIGLVLAARVSGDAQRPRILRGAAGAAAAPLGMGLYLSFSRGALFACLTGLGALIVLAPRREQARALAITVLTGALAAAAAAPFSWVTKLAGARSKADGQGLVCLGLLALIAALGAGLALASARRRDGKLDLPRRTPLIVTVLACAALVLAIVLGSKESSKLPSGTSAARYTTLRSDRYDYWRVALNAFASEPVHGVGAGGWAVQWLIHRRTPGFASDAHSLELQTLGELGIVGLALLIGLLAGVALAARAAWVRAPGLAAGPVAVLAVYLAHSPLDWDWQLPALTLVAVLAAGQVLGLSGAGPGAREGGREWRERPVEGLPEGHGAALGNRLPA